MAKFGLLKYRDLYNVTGQIKGDHISCPCATHRKVWIHPTLNVVAITNTEDDHQRFKSRFNWMEVTAIQCTLVGTDSYSMFDASIDDAVAGAQLRAPLITQRDEVTPLGGSGAADQREKTPTTDEMKDFIYKVDERAQFLDRFLHGTRNIQSVLKWTTSQSTYFNILRDFIHFSSESNGSSSSESLTTATRRRAAVNAIKDQGTLLERASKAAVALVEKQKAAAALAD